MKKNLNKIYGKVSDMSKEYRHYFKPVYLHEGKEDQLLQLAIERSEVIEEEIHLCGYFCIITSKKMTAKDALELYKSRDESEKLFYTSLKDAVLEDDSKANYMNVPAAIKELEKIEMIRQTSGEYRLDHAVTAAQKAILKAFKMDAACIQKEAAIREALMTEDKK